MIVIVFMAPKALLRKNISFAWSSNIDFLHKHKDEKPGMQ